MAWTQNSNLAWRGTELGYSLSVFHKFALKQLHAEPTTAFSLAHLPIILPGITTQQQTGFQPNAKSSLNIEWPEFLAAMLQACLALLTCFLPPARLCMWAHPISRGSHGYLSLMQRT